MRPRNVLTIGASLVALATLVLAGIEVARRFGEKVSLYELLFAVCAVVTSLVCIGVLDWARNLGGGPARYPVRNGDYEPGESAERSPVVASEAEAHLMAAIHELHDLANEELGVEKTVDEALRIVARFADATRVSLWSIEESGAAVPRAQYADGEVQFSEDAVSESLDEETLRQAVELRKPFEAQDAEAASFVLPLVVNRRTTGVLKVVVPIEGSDQEERHDAAQQVGVGLAQLAQHVTRAVRAPTLYEEALIDNVTGLYTRRHFINRLSEVSGASRRYGEPLALVLLDVDNFEMCNRNHGRATGDRVLQDIATLAQDNVREADSAYRYGPDEIAVILPETDVDRAATLAERLCGAIRAGRTLCDDGSSILVSVSVGVAEFDEDMRGIGPLMARAEEALYAAKAAGRDRVERWREGAGTDALGDVD